MTILDDSEPEDNESIIIRLTHTEGGSRILPSSDTVTVIILANDNVAGEVSFQTTSRSVTGHEGGFLSVLYSIILLASVLSTTFFVFSFAEGLLCLIM